ncbi:hypothetical protein HYX18_02600 [Candidatus Woesearchaeota archaeon]|nr:hypothetical protein [Candidatus Woesearchaeota archaeon]
MIFKKGQAAMEFLMTYGWAILVVLIAIGALAYFGVLNPGRFLPSACVISNQLGCEEFRVTSGASGTIDIIIRNGRGVNIQGDPATPTTELNLIVKTNIGGTEYTCDDAGTTITTLNDGVAQKYTYGVGECLSGTASPTSFGITGAKFKGELSLSYGDAGSTLGVRTATGTINTKIE